MTGTVCRLRRTLALGCLVLLGFGFASPILFAQQRVGVNSAVNPDAMGIPPGGVPKRLVLGQDVVFNERITTEAQGQTQVLFVDELTLSIGPNANMVIDQFVYDPNAGTGKLAASLTRGVFRFVGGKISKLDNAVTLHTPSGTIGIRGGVMLIRVRSDCGGGAASVEAGGCNALRVVFVYGKGVTITGLNGVTQTIYRPGFEVTVAKPGAAPSDPGPAPPSATTTMLAQLDGRAGSNGGAPKVPTEVTVANSGIANVISANVQASLQAAAKTQPQQSQPESVTPVITQAQLNNQNVQVSGASATAIGGGTVSFNRFLAHPTPQGTPILSATATTSPATPTPPIVPATPMMPTTRVTPPSPVVVSVAGLAKVSTTPPNTAGFNVQTADYRIPYTSGTITYPAGSVPQNGVFSTVINGAQVSLSPLTPGTTTAVTANALSLGAASGTATTTADGKFFFANLTSTTPGSQGTRLFIFGGVPVDQSFYAPTATKQFYAFTVNPDGALASSTSPQTIPFLPSNYGGTMPNATVSPLYLATIANQSFGNFNQITNPNGTAPHYLQASLRGQRPGREPKFRSRRDDRGFRHVEHRFGLWDRRGAWRCLH